MISERGDKISFEAFSKGREVVLETTKGRVTLTYEGLENVDSELKENLINYVNEIIQKGYSYIMDSTDKELSLSDQFTVRFANSESHAHQGVLMRVSKPRMINAITQKTNTSLQIFEQSQLTHELIHNLTDDEDFPMFIELIYLLEHRGGERLKEIQTIWQENEFPIKYVEGLINISTWLGYANIQDMFNGLQTSSLENLKSTFKDKIIAYYNKEIEELVV